MKTILISITLTLTSLLLTAQNTSNVSTDGTTITVTVPVPTSEGKVYFSLHNETTFMKKSLVDLESEIVDGKATVIFNNVAPGTYGVLLFHDKNGNQMMDFEPNGMPKEMFGVSNNVMSMGPPMWDNAKFEVTNEPIELEIRM